jgi:hypothetical protein
MPRERGTSVGRGRLLGHRADEGYGEKKQGREPRDGCGRWLVHLQDSPDTGFNVPLAGGEGGWAAGLGFCQLEQGAGIPGHGPR